MPVTQCGQFEVAEGFLTLMKSQLGKEFQLWGWDGWFRGAGPLVLVSTYLAINDIAVTIEEHGLDGIKFSTRSAKPNERDK